MPGSLSHPGTRNKPQVSLILVIAHAFIYLFIYFLHLTVPRERPCRAGLAGTWTSSPGDPGRQMGAASSPCVGAQGALGPRVTSPWACQPCRVPQPAGQELGDTARHRPGVGAPETRVPGTRVIQPVHRPLCRPGLWWKQPDNGSCSVSEETWGRRRRGHQALGAPSPEPPRAPAGRSAEG